MNTWRNLSIFRDYTLANCSHDWRVVDKSSTKRYRIYSKYTIEPTRSVNRIKCRIMVWYVESLRHLDSAQCSFSWRNNVAGWRCNSKRKSEEQLEWKVTNKFEKWEHTWRSCACGHSYIIYTWPCIAALWCVTLSPWKFSKTFENPPKS